MRLTRRKLVATGAVLIAAAALSALALGAGDASAGGATTHRFTVHARFANLDETTAVGELTGGQTGKWGAQIAHFKVQGTKVVGASTAYSRPGALFGPFTTNVTANPDGSVDFKGTSQIKGGTGLYRGAHGTVKITGTRAAGATVVNYIYKVTVTY